MLNDLVVTRQCLPRLMSCNLMDIKFDSKSVHGENDKYIKTKIKIYRDNISTNFQGKKVTKENPSHKYLSLIMQDSVVKVSKKYYPQILLKECKYEIKKTTMENLINEDLETSSSDDETDWRLNLIMCLTMNNLLKF